MLVHFKSYVSKQSPDFFKDVSFHVSFHVKFGYMGCCDFSINNPQNTCLVTWLLMWNITFWVECSIKKIGWEVATSASCHRCCWQALFSKISARPRSWGLTSCGDPVALLLVKTSLTCYGPWLISFTKWSANWDDPRPCKCMKT